MLSLIPPTSQKHASRWIDYAEMPIGMKKCLNLAVWWTGVPSEVYSLPRVQCSQARLGIDRESD